MDSTFLLIAGIGALFYFISKPTPTPDPPIVPPNIIPIDPIIPALPINPVPSLLPVTQASYYFRNVPSCQSGYAYAFKGTNPNNSNEAMWISPICIQQYQIPSGVNVCDANNDTSWQQYACLNSN
jgi:hypothetical protein